MGGSYTPQGLVLTALAQLTLPAPDPNLEPPSVRSVQEGFLVAADGGSSLVLIDARSTEPKCLSELRVAEAGPLVIQAAVSNGQHVSCAVSWRVDELTQVALVRIDLCSPNAYQLTLLGPPCPASYALAALDSEPNTVLVAIGADSSAETPSKGTDGEAVHRMGVEYDIWRVEAGAAVLHSRCHKETAGPFCRAGDAVAWVSVDVDVLAFELTGEGMRHVSTFAALSYIRDSKERHKYAAVCNGLGCVAESSRYVYLYKQPGEGQDQAAQQVIELETEDAFLGAQLTQEVLFLLQEGGLVAIPIKTPNA